MKQKPIKVTQSELAEYLGVTPQSVSEYKNSAISKRKLYLMLQGLLRIKEQKELRANK